MATSDAQALLLQVSADVRGLEKAMDRAAGNVAMNSRKMETNLTGLERFFGKPSIPRALDKVFDATRFKVLDSGVARVGIFGSALESLGGAGLVAAAGIGAVGLAIAQSLKTAEWADQLQEVSKRLGVTTTQLQEFDFIAKQTDIPIETMRASLQALNRTIGDVETGLAKKRVVSAFRDLLHIEPADVKRLGDVEHVLPAILDQAAKLSSAGRAAVAGALKIDPGVLNSLIEARGRLSDLIAEAHRYGIIVDEDVINRSAEAADKLKLAGDIIDKNLKAAFADLSPVIAAATLLLAEFIHKLVKVADQAGRTFGALANFQIAPLGKHPWDNLTVDSMLKALQGTPKTVDPTVSAAGGRTRRAPADTTASETAAVNAILDEANHKVAQALGALTDNIELRAEFEHRARLLEEAKENERLNAEEAKIKADKGLSQATKDALVAKLEEARTLNAQASVAKDQLEARQTSEAIEDHQIDVYRAITEALIDQLEAEAEVASTAAKRKLIEQRILDLRQQLERDLRGTELDRQLAHGEISQEQHDKLLGALGTQQAADRTRFAFEHRTPLQQFVGENSPDKAVEHFEQIGVNAFNNLADALAAAAANGENLGNVLLSFVRSLLQELLSQSIKNIGASFISSIFRVPAHAAGTSFAPGGVSLVGERGPELVRLPQGAQVLTASQTKSALAMRPRSGLGNVTLAVTVNAGGAIPREEIETMVRRGSIEAVTQARALARSDYASDQYDRFLNR